MIILELRYKHEEDRVYNFIRFERSIWTKLRKTCELHFSIEEDFYLIEIIRLYPEEHD